MDVNYTYGDHYFLLHTIYTDMCVYIIYIYIYIYMYIKSLCCTLRNGVFAVISVNRMSQSSVIPTVQMCISDLRGCPWRAVPAIRQPSATPQGEPWGASGWCEKGRIVVPDSWDAYERSDFSKPRLWHLHIHRKVLYDIWFSLINNNILMFKLPALYCKLLYHHTPPLAFLEHFSQSHLRCCVLALKS